MRYKIVNVPYGISSVYSKGLIEINSKIKGKLRERILEHEERHSLGFYSRNDLSNDFNSKDSYFLEVLWLSIKNPEMLINYFLVMYSYYLKKFTWNISALPPFVYFGLIFSIFFSLGFNISFSKALFGWGVIYALINLVLLLYTHIYLKTAKI